MFPPLTLKDRRHENFAIALAEGLPVSAAYRKAGHTAKNAKARGAALAKNPAIIRRVDHLRACLPRIHDLQAHYAPSTLFMPQTQQELSAHLWQITTGARQVTPVQMRALALFARINGWHLKSSLPPAQAAAPPPASDLTPEERALLIGLIHETAEADTHQTPISPTTQQTFLSSMADARFLPLSEDQSDQTDQTDPPDQTKLTRSPTIPAKSPLQDVENEAFGPENPRAGINFLPPASTPSQPPQTHRSLAPNHTPSPPPPVSQNPTPPLPTEPPKPTPLRCRLRPPHHPYDDQILPPGAPRPRWTSH